MIVPLVKVFFFLLWIFILSQINIKIRTLGDLCIFIKHTRWSFNYLTIQVIKELAAPSLISVGDIDFYMCSFTWPSFSFLSSFVLLFRTSIRLYATDSHDDYYCVYFMEYNIYTCSFSLLSLLLLFASLTFSLLFFALFSVVVSFQIKLFELTYIYIHEH
jgi:hypothetical protein